MAPACFWLCDAGNTRLEPMCIEDGCVTASRTDQDICILHRALGRVHRTNLTIELSTHVLGELGTSLGGPAVDLDVRKLTYFDGGLQLCTCLETGANYAERFRVIAG